MNAAVIKKAGSYCSRRIYYTDARDMIASGKDDFARLVTHEFSLDDFNKAVDIQGNPANKVLKVIIVP